LGLSPFSAAHAQRVTDYDFSNLVLLQNFSQLLEIQALVFSADGIQPLSAEAQRIGNRQANGFAANIERQNARGKSIGVVPTNGVWGISAGTSRL